MSPNTAKRPPNSAALRPVALSSNGRIAKPARTTESSNSINTAEVLASIETRG